jgi:cytochrome c
MPLLPWRAARSKTPVDDSIRIAGPQIALHAFALSNQEMFMNRYSIALAAALVAAAGSASAAADPAELAKKSGCLACHASDKKVVGPSYKDVAAKYKGDKGAEAKLIDKVKKGGAGVWGPMAMPPNAAVKDEDLKTLVQWVLSTK